MPLRGDLREFGIPEIFQLLEQQAKTGCLHINAGVRDVEVYFREGRVVGALPAGKNPWDQLAGILLRVGYLSEKDLQSLEKRQANDLSSLKEILRGQALLGPREIDALLTEAIEELLFPVFQKRRGEFFFVQDKRLPSDWELREPLSPEPLVLEGLRKSDEWPLLKKRIGSFHEVPQRRLAVEEPEHPRWKERVTNLWNRVRGRVQQEVPDGSQEEVPLEGEASLSSAEKAIYSLIDGRRNIEEIIHASLLGEYTACQAFLSLMDRGWIRLADPEVAIPAEEAVSPAGGRGEGSNLIRGALALSLALILLLTIQVVSPAPGERRLRAVPIVREEAPVCRLLNHAQRDRVMKALELYRKEKGRYPDELSELVQERLLLDKDLSLWGASRFSYVARADRFQLLIAPAAER
jgi:hypothetical protein